jgi:RNA recognition motif-containing protein
MNIYVGNLSREVTEDDLKQAFEAFGKVDTIAIIKDKVSGEPKGFAFIEMPDSAEAQAAMTGLNGKELKSRAMTVNEAKPKSDNKKSGGRGGYGGGRDNRSKDRGGNRY